MICMKSELKFIPEREAKPRKSGVTMCMDKGLSRRQAEDLVDSCGELLDVIKIGFGTGYVTPKLDRKLEVYREAGIPYYFGGTMLEAFYIRGQIDDYCRMAESFQASHVEVSDGSIHIPREDKCNLIKELSSNFTVLSEVGSKDSSVEIPPYKWVEWMQEEIDAGAWKVIAEARESGTVGVFQKSGDAKTGLVDEIVHHVPVDKILWEAPQKSQQVWFIRKFGSNVNLGNIAPHEMIPLETLRLGLRGDTFYNWLPEELQP